MYKAFKLGQVDKRLRLTFDRDITAHAQNTDYTVV